MIIEALAVTGEISLSLVKFRNHITASFFTE